MTLCVCSLPLLQSFWKALCCHVAMILQLKIVSQHLLLQLPLHRCLTGCEICKREENRLQKEACRKMGWRSKMSAHLICLIHPSLQDRNQIVFGDILWAKPVTIDFTAKINSHEKQHNCLGMKCLWLEAINWNSSLIGFQIKLWNEIRAWCPTWIAVPFLQEEFSTLVIFGFFRCLKGLWNIFCVSNTCVQCIDTFLRELGIVLLEKFPCFKQRADRLEWAI